MFLDYQKIGKMLVPVQKMPLGAFQLYMRQMKMETIKTETMKLSEIPKPPGGNIVLRIEQSQGAAVLKVCQDLGWRWNSGQLPTEWMPHIESWFLFLDATLLWSALGVTFGCVLYTISDPPAAVALPVGAG